MSYYKAVKSILYLAVPTAIGNVGIILTIVVDSIMLSQYSTQELTYRSAANIIHFFLVTVVAGFTQGIGIVSANFFGKKLYTECGRLVIKSSITLFIIGLLGTIVYWFGYYILLLLKQDYTLVTNTNHILKIIGIGFTPCVFYFAFIYFLESINKPMPVIVTVIITNIVNILLNWVLIFGKLGFPAMGATGSAISSVIVQFLAPFIILLHLIFMKDRKIYFNKKIRVPTREKSNYFIIGFGVAIVLGVEEIGYAANLIYAGWISDKTLASYALSMNILMVCMPIAVGLAEATSILVGIENGKKDTKGIKIITVTSLLLNLIIMSLIATILYFSSNTIPQIYSNDLLLTTILVPLIHVIAIVIIIDSSQMILSNALRGTKIVIVPTSVQIVSSLFIMLPFSWLFSIYLNMGVLGLLLGIILSNLFNFSVLTLSFYFLVKYIAKKHIKENTLHCNSTVS